MLLIREPQTNSRPSLRLSRTLYFRVARAYLCDGWTSCIGRQYARPWFAGAFVPTLAPKTEHLEALQNQHVIFSHAAPDTLDLIIRLDSPDLRLRWDDGAVVRVFLWQNIITLEQCALKMVLEMVLLELCRSLSKRFRSFDSTSFR